MSEEEINAGLLEQLDAKRRENERLYDEKRQLQEKYNGLYDAYHRLYQRHGMMMKKLKRYERHAG